MKRPRRVGTRERVSAYALAQPQGAPTQTQGTARGGKRALVLVLVLGPWPGLRFLCEPGRGSSGGFFTSLLSGAT